MITITEENVDDLLRQVDGISSCHKTSGCQGPTCRNREPHGVGECVEPGELSFRECEDIVAQAESANMSGKACNHRLIARMVAKAQLEKCRADKIGPFLLTGQDDPSKDGVYYVVRAK